MNRTHVRQRQRDQTVCRRHRHLHQTRLDRHPPPTRPQKRSAPRWIHRPPSPNSHIGTAPHLVGQQRRRQHCAAHGRRHHRPRRRPLRLQTGRRPTSPP